MKVLIIEDSELIRDRLVELIRNYVDIKSIEQTSDSIDALESFNKFLPDIVILDIRIPGGNGFRILKEIKQTNKLVKVIILTDNYNEQYITAYVEFGADYFLDKSTEFKLIPEILQEINQNLLLAD
ncbi:MAG: response regulator transcription factor [Bacteroidales bacterium]|nr:response regulator transcription factor [Bacteroidales bacterium]